MDSFQHCNLHEREKAIKCVSFFIIRHCYSNTDAYRFDSDCNVNRAINAPYYYACTRKHGSEIRPRTRPVITINNSDTVVDAVYGGSTLRFVLHTLESTPRGLVRHFSEEKERERGGMREKS